MNIYRIFDKIRFFQKEIFKKKRTFFEDYNNIILAGTPEIGQGLGRTLSCGACKPEQT